MKKFIFSALAAIGLLLSPSCSDENEVLSGSDNEALVSFNVQLAGGIQTKADGTQTSLGDGKKANKLFVKVYEYTGAGASGTYIPGLDKTVDVNSSTLSATVNVTLVKGKQYNFLFWAQHEEEGWDNPYSIGNDGTITVTYGQSNDEKRDAFVGIKTGYTVSASTESITLTRPFAQLNFLTTSEDIYSAAAAGIVDNTSTTVTLQTSVTIPNVATTYNPFTKVIDGNEEKTFASNAAMFHFSYSEGEGGVSKTLDISHEPGSVESTVKLSNGSETTYYVLATNYFLVNPANTSETNGSTLLSTAKLKIADSHYPGLEVTNVPVKMNHRTNIYGALLSVTGNINVSVEAGFSGTHTEAGEQ